ncbi:TIGR02444 family protein [Kangiella sediminilitoris]|uniref:TIGR02444 family protein n=1 Tax=Kangiella sediminilitoris TaxID=1144748 RepID=A0A1B3B8C7_9GAMM|nr:TIGR02444 family protein [Kangiella sediminilitoris]AOE49006.1 hypothetical protein KS2013_279 [Kangiella sediminilitoris]
MTNLDIVLEERDISAADWADEFWDWTCTVYANGDVQTQCLAMQNRFNCNVNFLLLAIWLGQRNYLIPKTGWVLLIKRTEKLRAGVRKLRQKRRQLKLKDREKYEELLDLELKGENLVQAKALETLLECNPSILEEVTVEPNLISYVQATRSGDEVESAAKELGALVQKLSD